MSQRQRHRLDSGRCWKPLSKYGWATAFESFRRSRDVAARLKCSTGFEGEPELCVRIRSQTLSRNREVACLALLNEAQEGEARARSREVPENDSPGAGFLRESAAPVRFRRFSISGPGGPRESLCRGRREGVQAGRGRFRHFFARSSPLPEGTWRFKRSSPAEATPVLKAR